MSGIILKTTAIKIVNKGGGFKTKMKKDVVKDAMGHEHTYTHQVISANRIKGTDYVVFNCPAPGCGKRNKKSMYEAKAVTKDKELSFICYNCRREIEVAKPKPKPAAVDLITSPDIQAPKYSGLLGPDGRPIHRRA
jgi:hypothetical protein